MDVAHVRWSVRAGDNPEVSDGFFLGFFLQNTPTQL